jgi:N-succinyldiaminopimelate aminotransferase
MQVEKVCSRKRWQMSVRFELCGMIRAPLAPSRWAWKPSIFTEMTMLSQKHNSINLGQGFPDWNPPAYVVTAAQRSISGTVSPLTNQYSRSAGMPRLCQALASHYGQRFGLKLDWQTNVAVTVGATEGIFASCMALLNPGDECIIIEPYYDSYPASVRMAGAIPVCVPMTAPPVGSRSSAAWKMDWSALEAAASPRTRMIIVNSPHNPTGKLFDLDELNQLAAFAQKHNAYVLSDEVYEHITFDGVVSPRMAQLPGMWERTLTLGSAGKTFSATGWKVRHCCVLNLHALVVPLLSRSNHLTCRSGGLGGGTSSSVRGSDVRETMDHILRHQPVARGCSCRL